jgi:hypothetical protein
MVAFSYVCNDAMNTELKMKISHYCPFKSYYILVVKEYNVDAVPDDVFAASVPG